MRGYELRILLKDGRVYKFDGLPAQAQEELADFCREHYGVPFEVKDLSIKGWNWGKAEIDGNHLEFKVGDKLAFDLPLNQVTNAVVATKDEIAIEFAQPEGADKKTDSMVEIRLYIPTTGAENRDTGRDDDDDDDDDGGETDAAKSLCEKIKGFSEMNNIAGDTFVTIPELPCIVPRYACPALRPVVGANPGAPVCRGRFELDMTATYLRLHGKSYDHKVLYSSIVKLFLLPKADETNVLFVLALDPPIRQGQTRYPFVVFQFNKDEEIEVDLQNIDEDMIKTKYEGKLQLHYEAPTFEVVSTLFRLLAGQKIIVPGSFRSCTDGNSIKCALKANEGFLYPLERNFLFLPKPVTLIPHADIAHVEFSRTGSGLGNPRSFDLRFYLKTGQDVSLSNIAKEEHMNLEEFLAAKGIEFRSKDEDIKRKKAAAPSGEDEEDDDRDFKRARSGGEESSPDEDYEASSEDSSVDEEYDEDFESGSGSGGGSGSGSDSGDDTDADEEEDDEGTDDDDE